MSHFMLELTDGFQERLAFDIANCSTDFDDGNFRILRSVFPVETALDLIGDMWDNLYSLSAEISAAFFLKNRSSISLPVVTLEFLFNFSSMKRS